MTAELLERCERAREDFRRVHRAEPTRILLGLTDYAGLVEYLAAAPFGSSMFQRANPVHYAVHYAARGVMACSNATIAHTAANDGRRTAVASIHTHEGYVEHRHSYPSTGFIQSDGLAFEIERIAFFKANPRALIEPGKCAACGGGRTREHEAREAALLARIDELESRWALDVAREARAQGKALKLRIVPPRPNGEFELERGRRMAVIRLPRGATHDDVVAAERVAESLRKDDAVSFVVILLPGFSIEIAEAAPVGQGEPRVTASARVDDGRDSRESFTVQLGPNRAIAVQILDGAIAASWVQNG